MIWGALFWVLAACGASMAYGNWNRGDRQFAVFQVVFAFFDAVYGTLLMAGVIA